MECHDKTAAEHDNSSVTVKSTRFRNRAVGSHHSRSHRTASSFLPSARCAALIRCMNYDYNINKLIIKIRRMEAMKLPLAERCGPCLLCCGDINEQSCIFRTQTSKTISLAPYVYCVFILCEVRKACLRCKGFVVDLSSERRPAAAAPLSYIASVNQSRKTTPVVELRGENPRGFCSCLFAIPRSERRAGMASPFIPFPLRLTGKCYFQVDLIRE